MHGMKYLPLHVGDELSGTSLVPVPVQVLGRRAELDQEIARQILRLDFASLFSPKAEQPSFIVAHNNPGVGPANK